MKFKTYFGTPNVYRVYGAFISCIVGSLCSACVTNRVYTGHFENLPTASVIIQGHSAGLAPLENQSLTSGAEWVVSSSLPLHFIDEQGNPIQNLTLKVSRNLDQKNEKYSGGTRNQSDPHLLKTDAEGMVTFVINKTVEKLDMEPIDVAYISPDTNWKKELAEKGEALQPSVTQITYTVQLSKNRYILDRRITPDSQKQPDRLDTIVITLNKVEDRAVKRAVKLREAELEKQAILEKANIQKKKMERTRVVKNSKKSTKWARHWLSSWINFTEEQVLAQYGHTPGVVDDEYGYDRSYVYGSNRTDGFGTPDGLYFSFLEGRCKRVKKSYPGNMDDFWENYPKIIDALPGHLDKSKLVVEKKYEGREVWRWIDGDLKWEALILCAPSFDPRSGKYVTKKNSNWRVVMIAVELFQ